MHYLLFIVAIGGVLLSPLPRSVLVFYQNSMTMLYTSVMVIPLLGKIKILQFF
jgi:hypothetical protein